MPPEPTAELKAAIPAPKLDPTKEFVAGGSQAVVSALTREALSIAIDDIERDFGTRIYERMMRDPAIYGAVETLKTITLSEELRVVPHVTEEDDPEFAKSKEIAEFIERCFNECETPMQHVMHEMLDALWRGSYVCEKVLRAESGKLFLDKLKTKHPHRTAYIVDRFYNVLGIGLREPDATDYQDLPSIDGIPVVPRDRFWCLKFWGIGGDPRGASLLRPAYNAWYIRQQTWPAYLKYLVQWATPSVIGTTPENATDTPYLDGNGDLQYDEGGNVLTKTPEEAMLESLLAFQGGSALALKGGSNVTLVQSTGDGKAFIEAMELFKREMILAVLRVTRATMESQHGSKADAEVAQDILGMFVVWIRRAVEDSLFRDVVKWLVELNFGRDAVRLAPWPSISAVEQQDVAALGDLVSKLFAAGYFDDSQIPELDNKLGMPERDLEAWLAQRADERDQARMNANELAKLRAPGSEEDPEDETDGVK